MNEGGQQEVERVHRRALPAFLHSSLARAARAIGRLGILIIAARLYSVDEVGLFAFALGIGTVASLITDGGLSVYILREIPATRFNSAGLELSALIVRAAGTPLGVAGAWAATSLLSPSLPTASLGTLAFAGAASLAEFLANLRRAHGRYDLELREIAPLFLGAPLLALVAGMAGASFDWFQVALGASALGLVTGRSIRMWIELRRKMTPSGDAPASRIQPVWRLLWKSRWFLVATVAGWALAEAPIILLGELADPQSVAMYASAMRPVALATYPFLVLVLLFVPSLAYSFAADREELCRHLERINLIFLFLLLPGFAAAVLAGDVLLRFFGPEYMPALSLVRVLALGFAIHFGIASSSGLVVIGRERAASLVSVAGVTLSVVLCLLLIPERGPMGAAIACFAGFALSKGCHVVLYFLHDLPVLPRKWLWLVAPVSCWLIASMYAPRALGVALLLAGGLLGGATAMFLMHRTGLFSPTKA